MKLLVKRLYCWGCCKLVRGKEQPNNGNIQVLCTICGKLLWLWNGIRWKSVR